MSDPWTLGPLEYQQSEVHFFTLQPENGCITGDKARPFLLKSGLPPNALAQIWTLSDINQDGKLDKLEFAIAMKLIRNCLAGMQLPPSLPESMKRVAPMAPPMSIPSFQPQMPSYAPPPMYAAPQHVPPRAPSVPATPTFEMGSKELGNWAIPQHMKLKFSQHFNQLDRNRIGTLTGTQARGVLGESQLPTPILATIWQLSDVNKDGCLSIEEFCIAMYLIEMVKSGYTLPPTLPSELATFCHRSKTASPCIEPNAPPPQKSPAPKTFEDKRRDNLDRGEAELERRRQILREEEDRRRAEIERREREEAERRERERLELERRREAEREQERQREREREEARQAEEARLLAEREELRKKQEQERLKELEKLRIRDLEGQYQSELEKTAQIRQRHKTMTFQLQALDEKAQQLNKDIADARDEIIAITSEIEKMRSERDEKRRRIDELSGKTQELSIQKQRLSHEILQLQSDCQETLSRSHEMESLKRQVMELTEQVVTNEEETQNVRERLVNQEKLISDKQPEWENSTESLKKLLGEYNELAKEFGRRQEELRSKAAEKTQPVAQSPKEPLPMYEVPPENADEKPSTFGFANFTANFESAFTASKQNNVEEPKQTQPHTPTSTATATATASALASTTTVKYRALYEFIARSDDELTIQPGDVILVFEGHASEPGWLAGQIKEKVGWFPAAFATRFTEPTNKTSTSVPTLTTSPSSEPLASIKEEPAEKELSGSFTNETATALTNTHLQNGSASTAAHALYDAPPISEVSSPAPVNNTPSTPTTTPTEEAIVGVATALYQWKARNDSELSFAKGDRIQILEKGEMRWRGRLEKSPTSIGWFPKSYAKLIDAPAQVKEQKSVDSQNSDGKASTVVSKSASAQSIKTTHDSTPTGEWYVALYQFDAVEATDLSLHPGDRIWVTETKDEWWKGTVNGKSGIFPANYVQKADSVALSAPVKENVGRAVAAYEATAANQISLRIGDMVRIRSTSPGGWWEGEVERDGNKLTGWFPGAYVNMITEDGVSSPVNGSSTHKHGELAEAAFDYVAQHTDELSFKAGEVIEIVDRSDTQWWKGRKEGTSEAPLLFPSNFVHLR